VLLAPLGRDAAVLCRVLGEGGIGCVAAADISELITLIRGGTIGAAMLTEEALTPGGVEQLTEALAEQPSWSDLPVLLLLAVVEQPLASQSARAARAARAALRVKGNITVLVRPVPSLALLTAVQAALRARRRQYEVRDLLHLEHAARLEAEQANRLKDEFLATVSHELRTPLSAILLWSRLISSGRVDSVNMRSALQSIERSAESQSRLIEDLLDVSRMVSGKLQLNVEEINLAPVAEDALAVVSPMAQAKSIRLEATIDADAGIVRADAARVQQVIWNLLGNAVKFTPARGSVSLDLRRADGHVVIRVSDTGQGIAAEFLPHVFERFRQADAAPTRRHGGLGLGLAITQQLVELHGGSVSVESAGLGKGTTFSVRLPWARPLDATLRQLAGAPSATPGPAPRLAGVRVLLVEDEAATRLGLTRVLEFTGAEVTAAGSATEALDALSGAAASGRRPHVLVSDIAMPDHDGHWLMMAVRRLEQGSKEMAAMPAIAISAYADATERVRSLESGFQLHVSKPIDPDVLVEAVARLAEADPVLNR
jgi:hypothetical protein